MAKRDGSVKFKLIGWIIFLTLLLQVSNTIFNYFQIKGILEKNLKESAKDLTASLAGSVYQTLIPYGDITAQEAKVFAKDFFVAQALDAANIITTKDSLHRILFVEKEGEVWTDSASQNSPQGVSKDNSLDNDLVRIVMASMEKGQNKIIEVNYDYKDFVVFTPFYYKSELIGGYYLLFSKEQYNTEILLLLLISFGQVVFYLTLKSLVTIWSAEKIVIKPLKKLVAILNDIDYKNPKLTTEENETFQLLSDKNDEIGYLSRTFKSLLKNLQHQLSVINELNQNLEQKVKLRTEEVFNKNKEIEILLQNMDLGVCTINEEGIIQDGFSEYLKTIFSIANPSGHHISDLFFRGEKESDYTKTVVKAAITACVGDTIFTFDVNHHLLPEELEIFAEGKSGSKKFISISWKPITGEEDYANKIILIIKDVTKIKKKDKENAIDTRGWELASQMLKAKYRSVISILNNNASRLDTIRKLTENKNITNVYEHGTFDDNLNKIFGHLHTIKGNSLCYGLTYLSEKAHYAEDYILDVKKENSAWKTGKFLELIESIYVENISYKTVLQEKIIEFFDKASDSVIIEEIKALVFSPDNQFNKEDLRAVFLRMSSLNLRELLEDTIAYAEDACRNLGKSAPAWHINEEVKIDAQYTALTRDILSHCVNNAIAHGIEPAIERQNSNKSVTPTITVDTTFEKERLCILFKDDGYGLNLGKIKSKGLREGLIKEGSHSLTEIANLIFTPCFSTSDTINQVAGRGIGMDSVKAQVEMMGGSVKLELIGEPINGYCQFVLKLYFPSHIGYLEDRGQHKQDTGLLAV